MKKIALIIDDDESLRNALADRIESMGFDHEVADSQHSATELLRKRRYDLILLDQELPVRKGKPTNKQVGRNLLEHIREEGLNQKSPVIIVTAHDGTDPMVACDLMNNGADYFLPKPRIDQLEVKIRETLARLKQKSQPTPPARPNKEPALKPFAGGRLEFHQDGIFLGEIRLASPGSNIGRILRELANLPASGKRRARSGQNLADSLGLARGNLAISEAICPFRKQAVEQLRNAGFEADSDTVIASGKGGYLLAPKIEVAAQSAQTASPDPAAEPSQEERVAWFIAEAEAGRKPRKALHLNRFGISESTWKRDLHLITERLEIIGTGAAAHYIPKQKTRSLSIISEN